MPTEKDTRMNLCFFMLKQTGFHNLKRHYYGPVTHKNPQTWSLSLFSLSQKSLTAHQMIRISLLSLSPQRRSSRLTASRPQFSPALLTASRPLGSHFSLLTSHFSDLTPPELQTVDLSLTGSVGLGLDWVS